MTQLVYSGLVDEMFGFNAGFVDFGEEVTGKASARVKLGSDDEIYTLIRDLNFSEVGQVLNKKTRELGDSYEERHSAKKSMRLRPPLRANFDVQFLKSNNLYLSLVACR